MLSELINLFELSTLVPRLWEPQLPGFSIQERHGNNTYKKIELIT